jgi:ribosome-associated protein
MGRRDTFQYVREDQGDPWEPAERPLRSESRDAERQLELLTRRVLALRPEQRRGLPIGAEAREAIEVLLAMPRTAALARQTRRVRLLLRMEDQGALLRFVDGVPESGAADPAVEAWADALIAGDEALQQLLEAHPDADRQRLRALARGARTGGSAARRKLSEALSEVGPLEGPPSDPPEGPADGPSGEPQAD